MLIGADFDQSPMAYCRLPDVLPAYVGAVKILHTLQPVIVVMSGRGKGLKCAAAE
jgi:tRNA-splicing ligase RtcB